VFEDIGVFLKKEIGSRLKALGVEHTSIVHIISITIFMPNCFHY
jgi:hypothetical protein